MSPESISTLVARRESLMDEIDAAYARAETESGDSVSIGTARRVRTALLSLLQQLRALDAPSSELARTLRYLASLAYDLAAADGQQSLRTALGELRDAERALSGVDVLESAKIDFATANALRRIEPVAVENLVDAARRIERAGEILGREAPRLRPQVEQLGKLVNDMLSLARRAQQLSESIEAVKGRLDNLMARAAPNQTLAALLALVQQNAAAGKLDRDREASLTKLLERAARVLDDRDDIDDIIRSGSTTRDIGLDAVEFLHYSSHGLPRPPAGSRAAAVVEQLWLLRRELAFEMMSRGKSDRESAALIDLSTRATQVDRRLYECGADNQRTRALEAEVVRPLALEIRRFAARRVPMLVRPVWSSRRNRPDPSGVFVSGSSDARSHVETAIRDRGLRLLEPHANEEVATARWDALRNAHVVVIDASARQGPERRAAAFYDLGIARTLGKSTVVFARADDVLPFNLAQTALVFSDSDDARAIGDALDAAIAWLPDLPDDDAVVDTLDDIDRRFPRPRQNIYADQALAHLARLRSGSTAQGERVDPLAVGEALATFVDLNGDPGVTIVYPAWRPRYGRDHGMRRLFHVMPFGAAWSDDAANVVAAACREDAQAEYRRGDHSDRANVIEGIWEDLAVASHVLVDLTDFNANVAFELGIAHVLGRPTKIVGQGDTVKRLFPAIAKSRFEQYDRATGTSLRKIAGEFLAQAGR